MVSFSRPFVALALASCLSSAALAQNVKLNLPLPLNPPRNGGDVVAFRMTPDESRFVYLAREQGDLRSELYSLPLDGSGPAVRLTDVVPAAEAPTHEGLRLHPESGELLFVTIAPEAIPDGHVTVYRLYRVSPLGDKKAELVTRIDSLGYWLVGDSVVFERLGATYEDEIAGAPLVGGGEPVLLASHAVISAVSDERVVYLQGHPTGGFDIRSVRPDGTGDVRLDGPHVAGGRPLLDLAITPDGASLLYRADQLTDEQIELFRVPLDGSAPAQRISGALPADRDVRGLLAISPDSTRALFLCDLDVRARPEIFVVPVDGSAAPIELNGPFQNRTEVELARFSDDGTRVFYVADALTDGREQLFSVPSTGGGPALLLTPFARDADVLDPSFAPNGRVLYRAHADQAADELYSVPQDGSTPPVRIGQVTGTNADVRNYSASGDGGRVLFFADVLQDQRFDLYTTPADGSAPQVRIDLAGRPN